MHNTVLLAKTAKRFGIEPYAIIPIVLDYIKTGNLALYQIRMGKVFGNLSPFIERDLAATIKESREYYHALPHVTDIELTPFRLIITYEDNFDETC